MPNYFNFNRGKEHYWIKSSQRDYTYTERESNWDREKKSSKDLIIDGNSVYEIDQDCFERAKKNRMNHRQEGNKK